MNHHSKMKMVSSGQPRTPGPADDLSLLYHLPLFDIKSAQMRIGAEQAKAVVYHHGISVNAEITDKYNLPIIGGRYGRMCHRSQIQTQMDLFIDNALDKNVATTKIVGSSLLGSPLADAYDRPRTIGARARIAW